MEYLDENAINIFTDGSQLAGPRTGGVGWQYVVVDEAGNEERHDENVAGFRGANNQQMELQAPIEALELLRREWSPVNPDRFGKIVIWSDSDYLVSNIKFAQGYWRSNGWMKQDGNPVLNVEQWKRLLKEIERSGKRVEFKWIKGHKSSVGNKRADKLAKQSAKAPGTKVISISSVRRKKSPNSVQAGSVEMHGQRLTVHIIEEQALVAQGLARYRYEVVSKASPYYQRVDWIFADDTLNLRCGHTYYVRVNTDTQAPRIAKIFREIPRVSPTSYT